MAGRVSKESVRVADEPTGKRVDSKARLLGLHWIA